MGQMLYQVLIYFESEVYFSAWPCNSEMLPFFPPGSNMCECTGGGGESVRCIWYYHAWSFPAPSTSFVSATQANFSHPPTLIWDNSLSFYCCLVMFDSAAQGF